MGSGLEGAVLRGYCNAHSPFVVTVTVRGKDLSYLRVNVDVKIYRDDAKG